MVAAGEKRRQADHQCGGHNRSQQRFVLRCEVNRNAGTECHRHPWQQAPRSAFGQYPLLQRAGDGGPAIETRAKDLRANAVPKRPGRGIVAFAHPRLLHDQGPVIAVSSLTYGIRRAV